MLAEANENGTTIDWYKKNSFLSDNDLTDPNVVDEVDYKMWEPATDVEGKYILNAYHRGIQQQRTTKNNKDCIGRRCCLMLFHVVVII